ncbi:unnamed protein product [Microthlaspi erraticum]|uniref:Pectinesterase catalytic domain-containing protein n=1 Tax=Microthlaspi erraticum TaxID=1685480 RepID=A0A6D2I9C9_9BRAS|nr:unnamed protein product [Microthlaspi erraticum]
MNVYVLATQPTYPARPWKLYSITVYTNTYMSQLVHPRGWLEWFGNFALNTLWYGRMANTLILGRVGGHRVGLNGLVIMSWTNGLQCPSTSFIDGRRWLPTTGVTFTAG